MAKKIEEGVWRTIGGRRVFIRTGQSLSDAMKESGKFSRVKKNEKLYKKIESEKEKEKMTYEEFKNKIEEITSSPSYKEKMDKAVDELNEKYGYKNDWREQVQKNNEQLEKDVTNLQNKINEYRNKSYASQGVEKYQYWQQAEKLQEQYYERFRENERANAKIKVENPNEEYILLDAHAGYRDKFTSTWGEDGSNDKVVSAKMYTNDEFMEHLEDANWHSERRQLLEAKLTNQELSYIKDRTQVTAWGVQNLEGKEQVNNLIREAKTKFGSNSLMNRYSGTADYLRQTTNMSGAQILELLKKIDEEKK